MTKLLFLTFLFSFTSLSLNAQTNYGMVSASTSDRPITTGELLEKLQKKPIEKIIVRGRIAEVCQREGCWMKLKSDGANDIIVTFIDHTFVVPKDIAGKMATVYGSAAMKAVSVEDLKEQAKDAERSEAEIASIKKSKVQARINAVGVKVE
jgi:hypothetical protein